MNIGEPKRELEIQPLVLPVPETVPIPAPSREPTTEPEPAVVPGPVEEREPVGRVVVGKRR